MNNKSSIQSETPRSFTGGTKTCGVVATPEALMASSEDSQAKYVWVGARVDAAKVAANTSVVFVGDATNQNIPLAIDDVEGIIIPIDDASKVYIKVGTVGDGVFWRILGY